GDKLDVSGNDMLLWWERDGLTRLAILYIESFGNPRKFARTARRVSGTMPVLTVQADTAASQALFEQAGVITTRGFGELVEAAALLATQPVPAGRTVAIVSNVGSAAQLAADACADRGLSVYHPHGQARRRLRTLIPAGTVTGPVEPTTPVSAEAYRQCLKLLAADEQVDAIVAIALPTGATGDLEAAIQAADVRVPLAAVVLTQPEFVRLLNDRVPAYGSPEAAVRALARAAGYGAWRAAPRGQVPILPDVRTEAARALVRERTGWLGPAQAAELLSCYGIPLADLAPPGPQVKVRVAGDRVFGPLVTVEAGDSSRTARFTPLTDVDAAYLVESHPSADPGALPDRGDPSPRTPLADLLLRVSRLADDLPEVTELDLDLGGAAVINARVKVEPYQPLDPFLRKLR
ncbi:MAG TPA: acetate--CoA ligase family protein, partial [Streptosporangiaceae bacterium]